MKEKLIPIVSILVGLLAFILTLQYQRRRDAELVRLKDEIYGGARKIEVVVAKDDMPAESEITWADLRKTEIFESAAPDHVVTPAQAAMIVGKKTLFEIRATKPVLWTYVEGGAPSQRSLATSIKPGLRAISLAVSGSAAVSGMVRPNDRVDVLGTFTFPSETTPGELETVTLTVLQDVTILATGDRMADQTTRRSRPSAYSTVTVEVTAREAELLVFAQQMKGRLVLSLRNPRDTSFEQDLPSVNFEHLQTKLPELNASRQRNIRHKTRSTP